ncbi:UbiA prenyltransferase [Byssothecium circinans]|uniref:UbiA prenyltransferase n=1 Tax=Byssothecium circinans TaxID=147558 RepID=A0A6A5U8W6_9PLEO|nr:UbiA prenyltransferase [Byssothecium circinans]
MASVRQLSGFTFANNADAESLLSRNFRDLIELSRLYHPAPILLIYFPHLYGILYASIRQYISYETIFLRSCALLVGSVFFSNAAHIWNDIVDEPLDAQTPRTRTRPIPRGAVSKKRAALLCITQAILATLAFSFFPLPNSVVYAIPNIIATTYYPWSKRHMDYPQFVLGFCIAYGVAIGALIMGMAPFTLQNGGVVVQPEVLCLFLAVLFWTVIFDTVYAHLDVDSDVKIGIRSTAVRFRGCAKWFLAVQLVCMIYALVLLGVWGNMSVAYYVFAVGGSLLSLGLLIYCVDLESSQSCWWWFGTGFWYTGGAILIGLLVEYILA